jgi:hypothetical protein
MMMKTTLSVLLLAFVLSACSQTNNNGTSNHRLSGVSTNPYKGSLRGLIPQKVRGCEFMDIRETQPNDREQVENLAVTCYATKEELDRWQSTGLSSGPEIMIRVVNWSTIEHARRSLVNYRRDFEYLRDTRISDPIAITSNAYMRDGRQVGERIVEDYGETSGSRPHRSVAWRDGTLVFGISEASRYKVQAIEESLITRK